MSGWESSLVKAADFGDRGGLSLDLITAEMIARQPAEAQAIIRVLLAKLAELEAEVRALKKTPQNSTVMSNSRAARFAASAGEASAAEGEIEAEARGTAGACPVRAAADSLRAV